MGWEDDTEVGDSLETLFGATAAPAGKAKSKWIRCGLGWDSGTTLLAAATAQTIEVTPQGPFRPKFLTVSKAVMGDCVIDDVKVANKPQFPTTGSLPGDNFGPDMDDSNRIPLKGDLAIPGIKIYVILTNTSSVSRRFRGTLLGLGLP